MQFEDRSREETERQKRCSRIKAWNLVKNIYKLKEKPSYTLLANGKSTPGCVTTTICCTNLSYAASDENFQKTNAAVDKE